MRILNLSNFFPPHTLGGYEQWCQEVSERLRARGHDVAVVTSQFRTGRRQGDEPSWVYRRLRLEMELGSARNAVRFFTSRRADEQQNLGLLQALVGDLAPDCVLVWGMWNLHRSLPALLEQLLPGRVAYYVGDYWPTLPSQFGPYWESPARTWLTAAFKTPLRAVARRILAREERPTLQFRNAMFPTAFVRDELARQGVRAEHGTVVYGAIDTNAYVSASPLQATDGRVLRLLYVGRLTEDKGIHTAVEALARIVQRHSATRITLTIVGSGDSRYENRLKGQARQLGVDRYLSFVGAKPKEAMPSLYGEFDVLLFTSIWPEPFGRVLVEAMAAGLTVIGTATGGAAEILADGENALTFQAGDADGLARQIMRLLERPALRHELAYRGRRDVCAKFDIDRMATEIESFLRQMARAAARDHDNRTGGTLTPKYLGNNNFGLTSSS